MALIASQKSKTVSKPAPAGAHVARCVRCVDIGLHPKMDDPATFQHKIMLFFELPTELHTFREENGPEPFMVSREYLVSLNEKAALYKDLISWRGKAFTKDELKTFNVASVIGAPCTLNIVHAPEKNPQSQPPRIYANIASIAPLMKGMTCPKAINEPLLYEIENERDETFAKLPEWVRKKIESAKNWMQEPPDPDTEADVEAASQNIITGLHDEPPPF